MSTSGPAISPKPGQRKALMAGYGSKAAIESCRKMFELLGRNAREFNFDVIPMIGGSPEEKLDMDRLMKSLRLLIDQMSKEPGDEDTLLVYLCLRGQSDILNLKRLMDIQYRHMNDKFQTHVTAEDGSLVAALKNMVFILDVDQKIVLTEDPFHHITQGTTILAVNGNWDKVSRTGKYTYFSGMLIEGLKGGAANLWGWVTLLNLHRFMLEAVEFESEAKVQAKVLASESVFLRRTRGIMHRRDLKVFCEAFSVKTDDKSVLSYSPYISLEDVEKNEKLKELLDTLLDLHLIDRFKVEDETWFSKILGHKPQVSKQGYILSALGKHVQDMWNNRYFKYL